jgi:hypothetical protein
MLHVLAATTLLLTGADHWTTYLCLRRPVSGWEIVEANPLAQWLFDWAGLLPGLLIDSAITLLAIIFVMTTTRFPKPAKYSVLAFITMTTAYAVANNLQALTALGISPLGSS